MPYKIKKQKSKNPYADLEEKRLSQKYKGKRIPYAQEEKVMDKRLFNIEKRIRQKDEVVEYKGNLAVVKKVTKNGIYIQEFKKGKDELSYPSQRLTFVTNKKAEKMYPAMTPNYLLLDAIV